MSKILMTLFVTMVSAGAWIYSGASVFRAQGGKSMASALESIMPAAGGETDIALHKVLYEINMISVASGAGVVGIHGTMYYEQGAACDAWTTDQRFTMEYQYPERSPVNNTNHYVAWESKDGQSFEFNSEREENGRPAEFLRGSVPRNADGTGQAKYTRPGELKFDLPKGYFLPTQHTAEVLRHARAGDKFFSAILFDGTDEEGPVEITTAISGKVTPDEVKKLFAQDAGKIDLSLFASDAWHVRMAVFPLKDEDMMPSYEMDIILHGNGVVSHSIVDYKTFKVEQRLKTAERLPPPKC